MNLIPFAPSTSPAHNTNDDQPTQAADITGRWHVGQLTITLRRRRDHYYVVKVRNVMADASARFVLRDDDIVRLFMLSESVSTRNGAFGLAVARMVDELYDEVITCRR